MIWILLIGLVQASVLLKREVLNEVVAEDELLIVKYTVINNSTDNIYDVNLYDPSFSRQHFRLPEGKAKVRLTYGTIKPEQTPYVNFEMIPKASMKLKLEQIVLNYTVHDEVITDYFPEFNSTETIVILSRRAALFTERYITEWTLSAFGLFAVVFIPVLFGISARRKRMSMMERIKKE